MWHFGRLLHSELPFGPSLYAALGSADDFSARLLRFSIRDGQTPPLAYSVRSALGLERSDAALDDRQASILSDSSEGAAKPAVRSVPVVPGDVERQLVLEARRVLLPSASHVLHAPLRAPTALASTFAKGIQATQNPMAVGTVVRSTCQRWLGLRALTMRGAVSTTFRGLGRRESRAMRRTVAGARTRLPVHAEGCALSNFGADSQASPRRPIIYVDISHVQPL